MSWFGFTHRAECIFKDIWREHPLFRQSIYDYAVSLYLSGMAKQKICGGALLRSIKEKIR